LEKQFTGATASIQKAREETTRLGAAAGEIACASAANPLLEPAVIPALTSRALAAQSLASQTAALAQTQSALASARDRCAALARDADARSRSNTAAAAGVKSAEAALAAAQSAEDKTAGEIKAANLDLLKWRTAAARLTADPQYASRKIETK
jgi:hypothetical protein